MFSQTRCKLRNNSFTNISHGWRDSRAQKNVCTINTLIAFRRLRNDQNQNNNESKWQWQTEHIPTNETTFKKRKLQHKVEWVTWLSSLSCIAHARFQGLAVCLNQLRNFSGFDFLSSFYSLFDDFRLQCFCYRLESRNDPNVRNWFAKYAFSDKNGFCS